MSSLPRRQLANAIRFLAMDAVQRANSGHPGMPMGMADIAEVLWNDFLRFNPKNPNWMNRDRFVVSNGHGAMLQYALLHLTGYDVTLTDLKNFRQLNSKTPGHPEYGHTPGVETTTGPLGQGLANAVGMALAEQRLAAHFNQDQQAIVDHYTYVFAGDGDLMEGISHEVCSLAGTWGLGKLIVFYDDNGISIDGDVSGWFTDDTPKRFDAYGWHVLPDVDGHDPVAIKAAIEAAQADQDRPTLICCKTVIGYGSPNLAGSEKTHGAPLGDEEINLIRENLQWDYVPFEIPDTIYNAWDAAERGQAREAAWNRQFAQYESNYPKLAAEFLRRMQGHLPENWASLADEFMHETRKANAAQATRKSSLACLNAFAPALPELIGGSADLSGSNCTLWSGCPADNYIEYGVREFGMSAVMNGLALHGGFIPYGGTFLTFSDYARNAVRLAALMQQKVIFVYTHDSIGLGEDGPTHQPVEHASMLRLTPGLQVWRPCDLYETAVAWRHAIEHEGPSCLLLTRQNLPQQQHDAPTTAAAERGAYVIYQSAAEAQAIIIATGSEVMLAVQAARELYQEQQIAVRVVSMPCTEQFDAQDDAYRESILPAAKCCRLAVEAASADYWYKYVGLQGRVIGLTQFGYSAPADQVFAALGITTQHIKAELMDLLQRQSCHIN